MAQSAQHNRFVASLIRTLALKEQQLSAYRAQARRTLPHSLPPSDLLPKPIHSPSLQEPQSPGLQTSQLHAVIADLQGKVEELSVRVEEEAVGRKECELKLEQLQRREQGYQQRLQDLTDKLHLEEGEGRKWKEQAGELAQQEGVLREQLQRMCVEAEYERILESKIASLARNLLEWQKFQQRVRQNIDAIIRKHCPHAAPDLPQGGKGRGEQTEQMIAKLAAIQHCLQMQHIPSFPSGSCLDRTLQDLLVMMEPVAEEEASLECSGGAREGEGSDCHSDNTTAVKETISKH